MTLLEEYLEGVKHFQEATGLRGVCFERALSFEELEAVDELMQLGSE